MSLRVMLGLAVSVLSLAGCREASHAAAPAAGPLPLAGYTVTQGGTVVSYPAWLAAYPVAQAEAETAIDALNPPIPDGWVVEIMPLEFVHPANPALIVTGLASLDERRLLVGFRSRFACNGTPVLPALEHERDHALHPDEPCFGHAPGDCP